LISVGAGLAALVGCGDAFNENCANSRSCKPPSSDQKNQAGGADDAPGSAGEAATEPPNDGAGGTAPGGSGGSGASVGAGASGAVAGSDSSGGSANGGPQIVSITPDDGAGDQALDTTVVVVFSEPLDPETVTETSFKLLDGDAQLKGRLELNDKHDRLTFKPDQPLDLFATYHVEISRDVTDSDGNQLADGFKSSFQARDGVWSVTTLDQAPSIVLPNSLPAAASGAVLATWLSGVADETTCTAGAAWTLRGQTKPSELLKPEASEGRASRYQREWRRMAGPSCYGSRKTSGRNRFNVDHGVPRPGRPRQTNFSLQERWEQPRMTAVGSAISGGKA